MLLLCNPSNEHGRLTSSLVSGQLFLFAGGCWIQDAYGQYEGAPSNESVRIWGFGNLLPPLPEHFQRFV